MNIEIQNIEMRDPSSIAWKYINGKTKKELGEVAG